MPRRLLIRGAAVPVCDWGFAWESGESGKQDSPGKKAQRSIGDSEFSLAIISSSAKMQPSDQTSILLS